ncbi:MAG: hypothetical protein ACJARN_002381, partial [Arenicella sp.]
MTEKKEKQNGSFSQVRQILKSAQGTKIPDYQGLGAFWMDYDILLSGKLYGNQLIAAAAGSESMDDDTAQASDSCCGTTSSDEASASQAGYKRCWPNGGGRE